MLRNHNFSTPKRLDNLMGTAMSRYSLIASMTISCSVIGCSPIQFDYDYVRAIGGPEAILEWAKHRTSYKDENNAGAALLSFDSPPQSQKGMDCFVALVEWQTAQYEAGHSAISRADLKQLVGESYRTALEVRLIYRKKLTEPDYVQTLDSPSREILLDRIEPPARLSDLHDLWSQAESDSQK